MSEEGQKGQNKVDFDSADIGKKQKAVQFTEIEGAEERARAAEKAKAAAEKAAEELHEANVEAVADRQVAVEKQEKLARGGVLYKIFAGWHKWAILGVLLLIGAGVAVYLIFFNKPTEAVPAKEAAKAFYDQMIAKSENSSASEDIIANDEEYKQKIDSLNTDEERYYYNAYYAVYVLRVNYDLVGATDKVGEAYSFLTDDYDKCVFLWSANIVYGGAPIEMPDEYYMESECDEE